MLAHELMMHRLGSNTHPKQSNGCYNDSLVVDPAFELGPLFARKLLHFLGVTMTKDQLGLKRKDGFAVDDMRITDLGPEYTLCNLNDAILKEHENSLVTLLSLANKSIAHLTYVCTDESDHSQLQPAKLAILDLMLKYVHGLEINAIWWCKQVSRPQPR